MRATQTHHQGVEEARARRHAARLEHARARRRVVDADERCGAMCLRVRVRQLSSCVRAGDEDNSRAKRPNVGTSTGGVWSHAPDAHAADTDAMAQARSSSTAPVLRADDSGARGSAEQPVAPAASTFQLEVRGGREGEG